MTTLTYTVKSGDGFAVIAREIFKQSHRPYIRTLVNRYDLVKKVAARIEADLKAEFQNFILKPGMKLILNSDIGYYIPRLALVAGKDTKKAAAKENANKQSSKDEYFVIHSTVVLISDKTLKEFQTKKRIGKGHAYINKEGKVFQIWPYNHPNGWATKAEHDDNKPELRGKLVNIELVYKDGSKKGKGEEPTEAQYEALADIYLETKKIFNRWLPIAAHREIDRGLASGHEDPKNFKFEHFYSILKKKGVPIDTIPKQSQKRFNIMPYCEHVWHWPPILSGMKFKKVTSDVYKTKCE